MSARSKGKLSTLPQVPPRGRRDRHRHAWRGRVVGPEQRRQGRRLPTRAAPRAEPQFRRGAEGAAAPGRGSTRFYANRACARQARSSNPGRSKMGAPAALAAALRRLDLSSGEGADRRGPDRSGAQRRRPRWLPRLSLVRSPRSRRPRHPRRRPRPAYKGSLTGGRKSLFCFSHGKQTRRVRLVLAEAAIDALSRAAIERLREDTIYAATGGGMGPSTIAALEAFLLALRNSPDALLESATDANPAGDRYAARHQEIAEQIGVPFKRLRPRIDGGDWNDVLKASVQGDRRHEA